MARHSTKQVLSRLAMAGLSLAVVLSVTGCKATVPLATDTEDQAVKTFSPPPGRANLFVVRPSAFAGSAILCQAALDSQMLGGLGPGTFLCCSVDPGEYTVSVFGNESQASQQVTTRAGCNHFVHVEVDMGWASARFSLATCNDEDGRQQVLDSHLAAGMKSMPAVMRPGGARPSSP